MSNKDGRKINDQGADGTQAKVIAETRTCYECGNTFYVEEGNPPVVCPYCESPQGMHEFNFQHTFFVQKIF